MRLVAVVYRGELMEKEPHHGSDHYSFEQGHLSVGLVRHRELTDVAGPLEGAQTKLCH